MPIGGDPMKYIPRIPVRWAWFILACVLVAIGLFVTRHRVVCPERTIYCLVTNRWTGQTEVQLLEYPAGSRTTSR